MCEIMENLMKKQSRDDRIESAKKLIATGKLSLEMISDSLDLPLDLVKELANTREESKPESV